MQSTGNSCWFDGCLVFQKCFEVSVKMVSSTHYSILVDCCDSTKVHACSVQDVHNKLFNSPTIFLSVTVSPQTSY